jgi:hypothetical protein
MSSQEVGRKERHFDRLDDKLSRWLTESMGTKSSAVP